MQITNEKKLSISSLKSFRLWRRDVLKRAVDILVSALVLLFLSPVFLYLAWIIKRHEPGPVLFRGARIGRDGKPFRILKFRTMVESSESYKGPGITAKNDERVTPLGKWLRDTKLNELPQFWNVLIGDMSLVGPRPEDPGIVAAWPADVRADILSLRPGITSPASVLYRDEENLLQEDNVMDSYLHDILPDKLRLDRLYVHHHSFMGDLDILILTMIAIVLRMARPRIGEGDLFAGPLYRLMRRNVSWFVLDLIICLLAVTVIGVFWRLFGPIDWGIGPLAILALVLAILISSMNAFLGLDRVVWSRAGASDAMALVLSNAMSLVSILWVNYFHEQNALISLPALPPEMLILMVGLTFTGLLFARYRSRLVVYLADRLLSWRRRRGGYGERALIVGAGEGGQVVNWLLHRGAFRYAYNVVGMVDDDPTKQGMRIDGCTVLGVSHDLPNLIREHDVGAILFTISNISQEARDEMLKFCTTQQVQVVLLDDVLDTFRQRFTRQAN